MLELLAYAYFAAFVAGLYAAWRLMTDDRTPRD